MKRAVVAGLCAALIALSGAITPAAQRPGMRGTAPPPPPTEDAPPVFRSGTVVVQIDALVTNANGEPVRGLTVDDFEVQEGGHRRSISSVSEVELAVPLPRDLPAVDAAEPDVATNRHPAGRTFVFAFEEIGPERAIRMRHVLREFLARQFGPDDYGAVTLLGRGLADSGQDFTSNRRLLLQAIDKVGGGWIDAPVANDTRREIQTNPDPCPRRPDARQLAASLRTLSEFLAKLPGRKVLVLVSEGLGGLDFNLLRSYRGEVLSLERTDAHAALSALTRGNVSVYPLNPCGLLPSTADDTIDTVPLKLDSEQDLKMLGDITGGFAITNTNNFTGAFDRIVRESSTYYTIGFESGYEKTDGRFVPVTVRVRRAGFQVQARAGYVAPIGQPRQFDRDRKDARLVTVADALASAIATPGVDLDVVATPYRTGRNDGHVSLLVETNLPTGNLVRKGDTLTTPFEVSYVATDRRGKVKPGNNYAATVTVPATAAKAGTPVRLYLWSDLTLSPGRYQVRVAAGTPSLGGSVVADVEVPDLSKPPLAMSGIFLTAATGSRPKAIAVSSPLANLMAPPITRRDFTRDEEVVVFAEVYDNRRDKAAAVVPSGWLRKPDGTAVPLMLAIRNASASASYKVLQCAARLPLMDLPAGDYVLELRAGAERPDPPEVSRRIQFRVR